MFAVEGGWIEEWGLRNYSKKWRKWTGQFIKVAQRLRGRVGNINPVDRQKLLDELSELIAVLRAHQATDSKVAE